MGKLLFWISACGGDSCEVTGRSVTESSVRGASAAEGSPRKTRISAGFKSEKSRGGATEVVGPRGPQGPEQEFGEKRDAPSGATEVDGHPERGRQKTEASRGIEHLGGATEVDVTRMSGPAEGQKRRAGAPGRLRAKRAARGPRP